MSSGKTMKGGIELHQWGFYRIGDGILIATCIAQTYYEAISYFEEIHLVLNVLYEIKIIK